MNGPSDPSPNPSMDRNLKDRQSRLNILQSLVKFKPVIGTLDKDSPVKRGISLL